MQGHALWVEHQSHILKGNPLRDPCRRAFPIYLPPSYTNRRGRHYPVIYLLTGHFGAGAAMMNWKPWEETLAGRADRLIRAKKMKETIIVMPDCFTSLGGAQYMNSPAVGRYEDYLQKEIVPWVDAHFRTIARPQARGITGKSSGAYGSLLHAMKYPNIFGLCAWRSGDAYFDFCYRKDMPHLLTMLESSDGSIRRFLTEWKRRGHPLSGRHADAINILAMAACYAPNARSPNGFDLPVDLKTGVWNETIWKKWLRHDPLNLVTRYHRNLKKLKWLYLECGRQDEYGLLYGTRQLSKKLKAIGIRHHYEEFDGGHRGTTERYDHVLSLMSRKLQAVP